MKWIETYATGVDRVDEQHRMIFKSVEDYRTALNAGDGERTYGLLLTFLDRYTRGHFAFEERCMEQYRCSVSLKNKGEHERLTEVVNGYMKRFKEKGFSDVEARMLIDTIDSWLDSHICRVDVHLRHCTKNTKA